MKRRNGYRYEVCGKCGREYNVSKNAKIRKRGYICPICSGKLKKKAVKAEKYILLTVIGILAFKIAADYALKERGCTAYGGEYLLLLMPLIYYLFADIIKTSVELVKTVWFCDGKE